MPGGERMCDVDQPGLQMSRTETVPERDQPLVEQCRGGSNCSPITKRSDLGTLDRRALLKTVSVGIAASIVSVGGAKADSDAEIHSVEANEGDESVVVRLSISEDASDEDFLRLRVFEETGDQINDSPGMPEPGDEHRAMPVNLIRPLEANETIFIAILPTGGYDLNRARNDAFAITDEVVQSGDAGIAPTLIDPDPASGFNYPYYLYAPARPDGSEPKPVLVEPANTGTVADDLDVHLEAGEQTISRGPGRTIAETLNLPFVVPVFPRPESDPVDWSHYVHQLDAETLAIEDGSLERVDLQVLAMVEDAQDRITDEVYPVADDIILNGFSASGNFVDRFTVLHPERILSVTAGGPNGMTLLPIEEADGHTLDYHIGIANIESLTGEPVDLDSLDQVNQFLYMGGDDTNDTIPFDDAWSDELRDIALEVYGDDMIAERFPRCQEAYREAGIDAQFRVYQGVGHTPSPAEGDIIEFHRRSIDGEDVSEFGQELVVVPTFEASTGSPAVGEPVEFDASDSSGGVGEIITFQWALGDGQTAVGETVTHTFEEDGEITVTLTVITDDGVEHEATKQLAVGGPADEADADTPQPTETPTETVLDADDQTDGEGSGFGVVAALSGLGGVSYLIRRRIGQSRNNFEK